MSFPSQRLTGRPVFWAWLAGALLFLVLFLAHANRLLSDGDEGLYLEGGRQILAGKLPHRDFFAVTGPATFWTQAALFQLFGMTLQTARMAALLCVSTLAGCVLVLTWTLRGRVAAGITCWIYICMVCADTNRIVVNHRWESATLITLSVTLLVVARQAYWLFLAGAAAALAPLYTPALALPSLVLLAWSGWQRNRLFLYGFAAMTVAGTVFLTLTGTLWPLLEQSRWLKEHYAGVNVTPYAFVIGGYRQLFQGSALQIGIAVVVVSLLTFAAWIPLFAGAGLLAGIRRQEYRREEVLLALTGIALILSTLPRPDLYHLQYVLAPILPLAVVAVPRLLPARAAALGVGLVFGGMSLLVTNGIGQVMRGASFPTRLGQVRATPGSVPDWQAMLAKVQPGDSLYVYPYQPLMYTLLAAQNPTRYSFLQPGMMGDREVSEVLSVLQPHPPQWLIYADMTPKHVLDVWPATPPDRTRLWRMEQWIAANYEPFQPPIAPGAYQLLRRKTALSSAHPPAFQAR